ncbi:MAG: CoA pyrophosphatase [Gemmatimonadetes bacterium]|nr:CoA pyrophosphatase [Gemmatimonadota bacterium]
MDAGVRAPRPVPDAAAQADLGAGEKGRVSPRQRLNADPRFGALREALSAYASDPDDPEPASAEILQAGVALVVRGRAALEVLLIKRAKREGDPWSGHMALPGGRRDSADASILHTAVRETREETSVDLDEIGVHLGRLEEVRPQSPRLPRISVTPHVFGVPAETPASVASPEVEAVHWVPLDVLRDPATRGEVEIPLPGGAQSFPCLRVVDDIVWGLTYRILDEFLSRAPEVFPLPRA